MKALREPSVEPPQEDDLGHEKPEADSDHHAQDPHQTTEPLIVDTAGRAVRGLAGRRRSGYPPVCR